jgi:hypothetical protein
MKPHLTQMPTDPRLDKVEAVLRSISNFDLKLLDGVARAIDEVVDPVRSARWEISELDQPEKTVFGIRVENVLRMDLELERSAKLDIKIAGEDVDVKFTIGANWSIPPEALNEICLVARFKEQDHSVSVGLVRTTDDALNPGKNRDAKRGLGLVGKGRIRWLVKDTVAESSIIGFMAGLPPELRRAITDTHVGAQVRQNRLFESLIGTPVPEALVEAISQHKDWTRRLRPDAANPKAPGRADIGYDVLRQSSPSDRRRLQRAGRTPLKPGFCISVDPTVVTP